MDLSETYDIEAEIEAELALIGEDEIQLSDHEDVDFTRLSDIVTEGWSSEGQMDSSPEKTEGGGQSEEEEDGSAIWNRLCASDKLASQLRADLEDCSKLLLDAEERIQSLDEAEYSIEITEMAKKQGKTPEELKREIIQDLEKLEQDLEDELSQKEITEPVDSSKPEFEEHLELVKLNQNHLPETSSNDEYFEKNSLVLVPSKQRNRLNTSSGNSMPGTPGGLDSVLGSMRTPTGGSGRPDTMLSTGRMTSLAAEWDQYLTEIEQELEQSASQLEAVDVEKEAFRRLLELHQSQKKSDHMRAARFLKHKDRLKQITEESQKKREQEKSALESEKNKLDLAKKELLSSVEQEEKQIKQKMAELEQQHNAYMQEKIGVLERERNELLKRQKEIEAETKAKHNSAATRIQKCYRGMLSRQKYSLLIKLRKRRMVEWRAMREADAIAEIALKNREKSKVDEEKRAKEAAAKAEKIKRENEEAKQKIKKAEDEKRKERTEKRRQENAEKAKALGTKEEVEKLELEQQAIELIEKLRSEDKSNAEKKLDKLNEQKKQNKGKKKKVTMDLNSTTAELTEEVKHDTENNTEAKNEKNSMSNDLTDIAEELNEDVRVEDLSEPSTTSRRVEDKPNMQNSNLIVNEQSSNLKLSSSWDLKADKNEQPQSVRGLTDKNLEQNCPPDETASKENNSVFEKEKTMFDINAELNNLIETEPEKSAVESESSADEQEKAMNNKNTVERNENNQKINNSQSAIQCKASSVCIDAGRLEECTSKFDSQSVIPAVASSTGIKELDSISNSSAVIIGANENQIKVNTARLDEISDKDVSNETKSDLRPNNETIDSGSEIASQQLDANKTQRSATTINSRPENLNSKFLNKVDNIDDEQCDKLEILAAKKEQILPGKNTKNLLHSESEDIDVQETTDGVVTLNKAGTENKIKPSDMVTSRSPQNTDCDGTTEKPYEVKMFTVELSAVLEQRRIQWMSDCIPWTKIKTVQKQAQNGAKPRMPMRSAASRKLKSMPQDIILSGCLGPASALMNVQTVVLSDLPGYNLEPFNNCVNLEYLVLDSCNILSLEGLANCASLKTIHAKHNKLESLYLGQLENLIELDVSSNRISSLAGLDGCSNLRVLNLMDNKVSRLGSLVGLKRLQQLNISANQLISTRGLSLVSSLTTLDVSSNHITALDEIESLAVLQVLVASGNAIQEMPRLTNNVLLRHVDLGSNCISSAATLSICWLPLLRTLNLSRNSLDSLPSLKTTINLEVMDCSCNEINTAESLIESLGSLGRIRILNAKDNPLVVDKDTLSKIRSELLSLIQFNEEELRRNTVSPETKKTPQFQSVCLSQLQLLESMESAIKLLHPVNGTENTAVLEYIATKTALLDLHFEMSVKLREEHEYGETHVAQTFVSVDSLINQNRVKVNALPDIGAEEKQEKYVRPPSRPKSSAKARSKTGEGSNSARRSDENRESSRRIQEIKVPSVPNETVEFVRNAWKSAVKDSNEQAASRIQAIWRGFWVRKKLSSIQAQVDEEIRQMMMEEDLELDEEIDLEQFNYLETEFSLDDWTIDQDPAAPEGQDVKTASNRRDSSRNSKWIDSSSIASQPLPTVLETEREKLKASISIDLARAEECVEQRTGEGLIDVRMRYHGSTMSGNEVAANDDAVSKIDLYDEIEEEENANSFSARQTKIAQDWGFKNSATAELMLKRAKKMSKVKKQIVTDIPQHSRMQTKGSHSSVLSNNNSSSVNSRRSSRLPNGSESMTSSRRSQHTNVLQQKVFEAGDFNTNAPSTDNYSRVFAWVNLGGSENGPERDGVHGTVVTGTTREHPSHSNRDSPLLRTGSPKPMGNPITPTAKRNSLPNAKQNVLYNDRDGGDMDILSVSDTRSQRSSQRGNRQQRSAGSPESKRTNNSSAISSFLNKTKVLPPINGKHVDRGSERTSSGGWGAGKKHSGKPPKPTRTYAK